MRMHEMALLQLFVCLSGCTSNKKVANLFFFSCRKLSYRTSCTCGVPMRTGKDHRKLVFILSLEAVHCPLLNTPINEVEENQIFVENSYNPTGFRFGHNVTWNEALKWNCYVENDGNNEEKKVAFWKSSVKTRGVSWWEPLNTEAAHLWTDMPWYHYTVYSEAKWESCSHRWHFWDRGWRGGHKRVFVLRSLEKCF